MVAHANKDEALRCEVISKRALADGDVRRARKFAEKAAALFPQLEGIRELLDQIDRAVTDDGPSPSTRTADTAETASATASTAQNGGAAAQNGGSTASSRQRGAAASSDPHGLVKLIRSKTCHYDVLLISKTANDDEIKRAYRKLALKLHPDKNKAEGADEAFKKVSRAFSVLSSADQRAAYDRYGDTDGMPARGFGGFRGRAGPQYAASFNGMEVDAEELFRMFFGGNPFMGGGFGGATFGGRQQQQQQQQSSLQQQYRRQRQQYRQQEQNTQPILRLLMSIAPIVMLLIFNLFSGSVPAYSLQQTREYPFPTMTSAHKVPFYVMDKNKFMKQYRLGSHERVRLEYEIEATFKEQVQRRCYQERLVKARYESYGQADKAAKASLASCDLRDATIKKKS